VLGVPARPRAPGAKAATPGEAEPATTSDEARSGSEDQAER